MFVVISPYLIPVVFLFFLSPPPLIYLPRHLSVIICLKEPILLFLFTFSLISIPFTSLLFPYPCIISVLISSLTHELFRKFFEIFSFFYLLTKMF